MEDATRGRLVEQYKAGYQVVVEALAGIGEAELDAREAPGEWSPREVVHHLADSEMTSAIRLRRLIVEERPLRDTQKLKYPATRRLRKRE